MSNGKIKQESAQVSVGSGSSAGELKGKALRLAQEISKQPATQPRGPDGARQAAVKPTADRGRGPDQATRRGPKGKSGVAGLGSGFGQEVGPKVARASSGAAGFVVKAAPAKTVAPKNRAHPAVIASHHAALVAVHKKDPLAFHKLFVKYAGTKRSLVLNDKHAAELGIKLPPSSDRKRDKSFHISTHVWRLDGKHVTQAAISQVFADELNQKYAEYNEMLSEAKECYSKGKGKFSSRLVADFPPLVNKITWGQLASSGLPYSKAMLSEVKMRNNMSLQVVDDRVHGTSVIPALLEYAPVVPREASTAWVPSVSPASDGTTIQVGVAHAFTKDSARERIVPGVHGSTITGSELLAPVEIVGNSTGPATLLTGAEVVSEPANPRMLDGSVVAELLEQYTQFRPNEIAFEFKTSDDTLDNGAGQMEFISDPADNIVLEVGFEALREGYIRTGSTEFSWWKNAECQLTFPLLTWFDTDNDDPTLELPGQIMIQNMVAKNVVVNGATLSLGFLACHYSYEVRAPGSPEAHAQEYWTEFFVAAFTGCVMVLQTPVKFATATAIGVGWPASVLVAGVVYWGTITGYVDNALGSSWRTWLRGNDDTKDYVVMGDTASTLYWRVLYVAGVPNVCFFPTISDALAATNYEAGGNFYLALSNDATAPRSFRIQDVQGMYVGGSFDY